MDPFQYTALQRARSAIDLAVNEGHAQNRALSSRNFVRALQVRQVQGLGRDPVDIEAFAALHFGSGSQGVSKAAISAMTSEPSAESRAFFGQAAERALLGRIGLRRVPFGVRTQLPDDGLVGSEVPEGHATPIRRPTLTPFVLRPRDIQAAFIATLESLQTFGPAIESGLESDLLNAVADAGDALFVADLLAAADSAGFTGDWRRAVRLLNPADADSLANELLDCNGGRYRGTPAFTSNAVPQGLVIVVDASRIAADWADGTVDVSREATVQQDTTPTQNSITPTASNAVSMWATSSAVIRATWRADWRILGSVGVEELAP